MLIGMSDTLLMENWLVTPLSLCYFRVMCDWNSSWANGFSCEILKLKVLHSL